MTQIRVEYCGMPGTGRTVREAKQDAARKIEAALDGTYQPMVLSYRGLTAVVWRVAKHGWVYGFLHELEASHFERCEPTCYPGAGEAEPTTALLACVNHMVSITRQEGEIDSPLFDALPPDMAAEARRTLALQAPWQDEFQRRYREAIAKGMSDNDAHAYASRNPSRPELWQEAA